MHKGQQATVKVDAIGGRALRGEVESVGILAEQGGWRDPNLREYTVKIKLIMEDGVAIRPSMRCEAEIQMDRIESALAVPVQAVFTEGLVRYVHVPSGSKFTRRPVKIGRRSDRFAEILGGVHESERVLVRKPEAREVLGAPWVRDELVAVGLDLTEDGKVIPKIAPAGAAEASAATQERPRPPRAVPRSENRGGG
jgi:multidrug efflux pump subunit AcrA (membrane-fusion protein)